MDKPMFIKLDEYNEVRDLLNLIKDKVAEAKEAVSRINKLRQEEESEIVSWIKEIEEIERKLSIIDTTLATPK